MGQVVRANHLSQLMLPLLLLLLLLRLLLPSLQLLLLLQLPLLLLLFGIIALASLFIRYDILFIC